MAQSVAVNDPRRLEDYATVAHLAGAVEELRAEAASVVPRLAGRTVWMVNSTSRGGGVAEMLPAQIAILRDLGVSVEWVVIESDEEEFFWLTKRLHNLIHGEGDAGLTADDRELFERVNRQNAEYLTSRVQPGDVLVVHDPQPMPLAAVLAEHVDVLSVWRCHIGLDAENAATRAAWDFLEPYGESYDHAVFSAQEYVPPTYADRATIIYPAINPFNAKNRELNLHKTVGVLAHSALAIAPGPLVAPPYEHIAMRLHHDGQFLPANAMEDFGLLTRPIVTQVSRWDALKGWEPLLRAFVELKTDILDGNGSTDPIHRRRQELVRLVLAGPDPASIQDDPEGREMLDALCKAYCDLDAHVRQDIGLFALPMESPYENALMVNALHRTATLVVQNSLREGFGLTVTEAMWKRVPVLTNSQACGPRQQVRDRVDGRLVPDPTDTHLIARTIDEMLADQRGRDAMGRNAQRHVHQRFLIFTQLRDWLKLFARLI